MKGGDQNGEEGTVRVRPHGAAIDQDAAGGGQRKKGGDGNGSEEEDREKAQVLSPQTVFELHQMRRKLNGILVQLDGLLRREKIDKIVQT